MLALAPGCGDRGTRGLREADVLGHDDFPYASLPYASAAPSLLLVR
jgi:hypothetical protein